MAPIKQPKREQSTSPHPYLKVNTTNYTKTVNNRVIYQAEREIITKCQKRFYKAKGLTQLSDLSILVKMTTPMYNAETTRKEYVITASYKFQFLEDVTLDEALLCMTNLIDFIKGMIKDRCNNDLTDWRYKLDKSDMSVFLSITSIVS